MAISDKLFAHINNDAFLIGSRTLEGADFRNTVGYLLSYVKKLKNKQIHMNHADDIQENMDALILRLEYLNKNANKILSIRQKLEDMTLSDIENDTAFKAYNQEIAGDILKLLSQPNQTDSLMIPGGWQNAMGGHAMIYEFKRDTNGDLIFIIHNTGAGLNHHNKVQQQDKERFCPIKVYRIPKEKVSKDKLSWFVGELSKPTLQIKNDRGFSADRLYKDVFPLMAYLDGTLENPTLHTKQESYITGQRSGTCAEKVLHQIVDSTFENKKDYKRFIYDFKRYALEEYTQSVISRNEMDKPGVRNQISLAVENMSRLLLKDDIFGKEKRKEELAYLKSIQDKFPRIEVKDKLGNKEVIKELSQLKASNDNLANVHLSIPTTENIPEFNSEITISSTKKIERPIEFIFDENKLLDNLETFKKSLEELLLKDPNATNQSIEQLFLSFPLPPQSRFLQLKNKLSEEDKRKFYELFNEINEVYIKTNNEVNKERLRLQFSIAQLSFISIITSISSNNQENNDFFNSVNELIAGEMIYIKSNAYFSSEDFICDERLEEVQQLFSNVIPPNYDAEDRIKKMYNQCIDKQSLQKGLEDYFNHFCEEKGIDERNRVNSKGKSDVRALFIMQQYMDCEENRKESFIREYCAYHKIEKGEFDNIKRAFDKVAKDLDHQHSLFKMVSKSWSFISKNGYSPEQSKNPIQIQNRGYQVEPLITPLSKMNNNGLKPPQTIRIPKNDLLNIIFDNYRLNANQIQIGNNIPYEIKIKSKNFKWIRELLQNRTSEFQIESTIDCFNQHLNYLKNENLQVLVEKNIFHPRLLTEVILNNPETMEKLNAFTKLGWQAFSRSNEMNSTSLFFNKLNIKISIYKMMIYSQKASAGETKFKEMYSSVNNELDKQLENITKLEGLATTGNHRYELNLQKSLILSAKLKLSSETDEKEGLIRDLISSLLMLANNQQPKEVENLLDNDFIDNALREVTLLLTDSKPSFITDTLTFALSKISSNYANVLKSGNLNWKIDLPMITLEKKNNEKFAVINLCTGKISRPGLSKVTLPNSILFDKMYVSLFGNAVPDALGNPENSYFEFDYKGVPFRIIKKMDGKVIIQRQFKGIDQENVWYQACDIKKITLQTILQQDSNLAWVSVSPSQTNENAKILIGKMDQSIQYSYQNQNKSLRKLDSNGLDSGVRVLSTDSFLHKLASSFEDPEFIIGLQTREGYQIQLPRYNITLNVNSTDDVQKPWVIRLEGTSYTLDIDNDQLVIPSLKSALKFASEKDKKVILPIQPFIIEAEISSQLKPANAHIVYSRHKEQEKDTSFQEPVLPDPSKRFERKKIPLGVRGAALTPSAKRVEINGIPDTSFKITTAEELEPTDFVEHQKTEKPSDSERTEYYNLIQDTSDYLRQDFLNIK